MGSSCAKYEKRLSAYMDGQLTPDEMAALASHLEKCPACSALLEKMRRLEEMAGGVIPDFDEALMADLSQRIADGIEEIEKTDSPLSEPRSKIIPIWYRYAAVAASVVIVFFVGRMAFKETGADLQRHSLPPASREVFRPAVIPPADLEKTASSEPISKPEDKDNEVERSESETALPPVTAEQPPQEAKVKSQEKGPAVDAADRGKKEDISPESIIQVPVAEAEEDLTPDQKQDQVSQGVFSDEVAPSQDIITPPGVSIITGTITDQESGEPLVGAAVQIEGTTTGTMTDFDGNFVIWDIPPDTYNLIYSAVGYKIKKIDSVAVPAGEQIRADAQIEMMPLALGEVSKVSGGREGIDIPAARPTAKKSVAELATVIEAPALTIDSLDALYDAATSGYVASALFSVTDAHKGVKTAPQIDRFRALLDSVEASPKAEVVYRKLESLYFKARASYDLYRETADKRYLDMASQYKNSMEEIITERLEEDENNQTLLNYKAEIERWRF